MEFSLQNDKENQYTAFSIAYPPLVVNIVFGLFLAICSVDKT